MTLATPHVPVQKRKLMRFATVAAVVVAVVLVILKGAAWWVTGSVSVLSSLADSALDATASLLNFFAVYAALQPADREHRYGHGKAEALSALLQAVLIFISAAALTYQAIHKIITPEPPGETGLGLWIMAVSMVLTIGLVLFQRYVVRETRSIAIAADTYHYQSDILMNTGVILVLVLVKWFGWLWVDPLVALGIVALIFHTSYRIFITALDILMDRELPDEERNRILAIALAHPAVSAVSDLRTRSAGHILFIQMSLRMDGDLKLNEAHDISHEVMEAVKTHFPESEVMIHEEPVDCACHLID